VAALLPAVAAGTTAGTTPDPCAGAPRTVAAQQAAFARIPGVGAAWTTADGYVPVVLPDARTAWLMSDTVVGPPAAAATAAPLVHNSIVVQRGGCFTPIMGGTAAQREDLVPELDGRACWQSAGVARGRTLLVFCTDVVQADGPPGFGFQVVGTTIATFDATTLAFVARVPLPFADPAGVQWGTSAIALGDWVYVYGTTSGAQYVARVRFDQVTTGPWHYWTGITWGRRDALVPMTYAGDAPVRSAFVTATGRGFVAVGFPHPLPDPTIAGWTASAPQGPWRTLGTVATATTTAGQFAYEARAVDLGRAGWAIVYNVNSTLAGAADPSTYGGRFVPAPRRLQGATKRCSDGCNPSLTVR
jgi:hypothetical protein